MKRTLTRLALLALAFTLTGLTLLPRTGDAQLFPCSEGTPEGGTEWRVAGCCRIGFYDFTLYRQYICQGGRLQYTKTTKCESPLCEL
ncbi:MAG TPA: hypothetical protein VHC97_20805 [Thermoanaerobaculia bacterium]|jgi:hypothetical protein|nr:hypothetical protein [Thermoanaerobaculia bacterium]